MLIIYAINHNVTNFTILQYSHYVIYIPIYCFLTEQNIYCNILIYYRIFKTTTIHVTLNVKKKK